MKPYQQKVKKPWGYELVLTPPEANAVAKILHINKGSRFSLQFHEKKAETLVLINGEAKLTWGNEKGKLYEEKMKNGRGYFIPRGLIHRCEAITGCDIFESSTKEEGTTVRLEDDYSRKDETEEERSKNRN